MKTSIIHLVNNAGVEVGESFMINGINLVTVLAISVDCVVICEGK